ncbi:MAG: chorismate mutase [Patescibacteria group bacterium]
MNEDFLKQLRKRIEKIDKEILKKLAERFAVAREIGRVKRERGDGVEDEKREAELRVFYRQTAAEFGLDADLVEKLFGFIISESKKLQDEVV